MRRFLVWFFDPKGATDGSPPWVLALLISGLAAGMTGVATALLIVSGS